MAKPLNYIATLANSSVNKVSDNRCVAALAQQNKNSKVKPNTTIINKLGPEGVNLLSNSKNLVVYGSNLGSTINMGRFSFNLKSLIFLTPNNYSIIVGKLLSDGYLNKIKRAATNSNTRFRFKQSIIRSDYVIHSFMLLSHYCSNLPYLVKSTRNGKLHFALEFSTRSLPCFNDLYLLFYKDINGYKKKVVPNNIYELLTPISIAHWIMGDGAVLNKGLVLCTESFTLREVVILVNVLKIKYNINSTRCALQGFKKNKPRIYILPESMPKLIEIVKPYMLSSMLYKLVSQPCGPLLNKGGSDTPATLDSHTRPNGVS